MSDKKYDKLKCHYGVVIQKHFKNKIQWEYNYLNLVLWAARNNKKRSFLSKENNYRYPEEIIGLQEWVVWRKCLGTVDQQIGHGSDIVLVTIP